ncbi:hypothetical protein IIV25_172R [Invertebrate iridovirus 25]|uniref:Uncharacterized protein n=1 Tax=Invertebrate iridovirus 25 TaxID=1301280 RepID=W8W2H0_9VIRU|nr:hypothetical protein IIV25_172R [Invertebrate iridovirus 25]CCV02190.1 hypothetical protein IIV25_172R [Invertebrate iridovirus 25]
MESKIVKHRLTQQQKESIIRMYINGTPISHLSNQFKVSRPTIYNIVENMDKDEETKIDFYIPKLDENKDMAESQKTNFLGVVIDPKNGSNNPKVRKALNTSFDLLDITQFIEVTKFKLNMVMFDYFWQIVVGMTNSHLTSSVLEWFGYEGEYYTQKQNFIKMLKRNNIEYRELTQKDKEVELYPTIQEELQLLPSNIKHSKFLIMKPNDLKMAIMQLKTKNGHIIRQYYIDLEELLKMYVEYTLYFNHRASLRKITNLEQMMADMKLEREQDRQLIINLNESNQRQEKYMRSLGIQLEDVKDQNDELLDNNKGLKKEVKKVQHKLGIAVEDRAPQPEDESKRERFVLIKRNDPEYYPYYTIRAQHSYTVRKLKFEKTNFPNLEVLLDFKCNPNSKTLFNRIKENLKATGVTFKGNNIDLEGTDISEDELIEEMKVINDAKRNV